MAAQDAVGDRMKRPAPDAAHVLAEQRFDASEHFARGAVGERDEQDWPGSDPGLNQPRDAISDRARLSRSGPGDDQNRPRAGADDRPLLFVQSFTIVDARRASRIRFDDELSRHWWLGRERGSGRARERGRVRWEEFLCPHALTLPLSRSLALQLSHYSASSSLIIAVCLMWATGRSFSPNNPRSTTISSWPRRS